MKDIEAQIEQRINAFVADMADLLHKAALHNAAAILEQQAQDGPGRPTTTIGAAPRPSRMATKQRSGRRTGKQLANLVQRTRAAIHANPGNGVGALSKRLDVPTSELTLPIRKLLATKQIFRKGERRATLYYPRPGKSGKSGK